MNKIVMNEAYIVTGGCGFVGRHLVKRLIKQGHDTIIIDNLSSGIHPEYWLTDFKKNIIQNPYAIHYKGKNNIIFFHLDVCEFFHNYAHFMQNSKVYINKIKDTFNFAACVGGRAKIEGDPISVGIDLAIDAQFFNWAIRENVERILYASSSAAYPIDLQEQGSAVQLREDHISFDKQLGKPDMTYGWAKLTGEYLARLTSQHYGIHTACIRPFSGYGEDQDLTYPVPAIAARAAQHEDPLVIWGTGTQGRDFVHIEDCIDAIFLALEKISDGSGINIGSGNLVTFYEVAQLFSELTGYSPEIKPLVDKPSGVHSRYADTTLMQQLLNWSPRISLRQGFSYVLEEAKMRLQHIQSE
jgi:nucleoside-diphosphate-sugar epimerase